MKFVTIFTVPLHTPVFSGSLPKSKQNTDFPEHIFLDAYQCWPDIGFLRPECENIHSHTATDEIENTRIFTFTPSIRLHKCYIWKTGIQCASNGLSLN